MKQYISTLQKELGPQTVNVVHIQLGQFDYGYNQAERQQLVVSSNLSKAEATKQRLEQTAVIRHAMGSPPRELHNGVFDAIVRGKGRNGTIYIGRGSRLYDFVGKWVPNGIVGWMMGVAKAPTIQKSPSEVSAEGSAEWEKVDKS